MVYKFRVILDTEEDIFRDIAILDTDTLEDLHNTISNAFGFDGSEMASFYTCDDKWNQQDEIPLFDTGDIEGEQSTMQDFALKDILDQDQTKIIYVYDFLNMFTFFVELAALEEQQTGENYPSLLFAHGEITGIDQKEFTADFEDDLYADFEDDFDEEDLDMFGDDEFGGYDEFSDDSWN
ncbi:MAG: hypothetical protein WCY89_03740 [Flavobacteriaceae bacterium]